MRISATLSSALRPRRSPAHSPGMPPVRQAFVRRR
jgi:hypothetical protein